MEKNERLTVASYDKISGGWKKLRTPDYWQGEIDYYSWRNERHAGFKILELGCAVGTESRLLEQAGFNYFGSDISEGLINAAKAELPDTKFVRHDILHLPYPDNTFDGFWTAATLLHLPKRKLGKALSEIYRVTKPGAFGFVAIKQGRGEKIVKDPDGRGKRLFSYYRQGEFWKKLEDHKLRVHGAGIRQSAHTTWLSYFTVTEK